VRFSSCSRGDRRRRLGVVRVCAYARRAVVVVGGGARVLPAASCPSIFFCRTVRALAAAAASSSVSERGGGATSVPAACAPPIFSSSSLARLLPWSPSPSRRRQRRGFAPFNRPEVHHPVVSHPRIPRLLRGDRQGRPFPFMGGEKDFGRGRNTGPKEDEGASSSSAASSKLPTRYAAEGSPGRTGARWGFVQLRSRRR
jgi:hypothetical protein